MSIVIEPKKDRYYCFICQEFRSADEQKEDVFCSVCDNGHLTRVEPFTIDIRLFEAAMLKWGYHAQENKYVEECAELIKAVMKYRLEGTLERKKEFYGEIIDT